jgi:GNAT superfamily N-acetyltransferase
MSEVFEFRRAALEDSEAVTPLCTELGYPSSVSDVRSRLAELLDLENHEIYLATIPGGKVVGWAHVFGVSSLVSAPFAEVGGLVVAAGHRGRGVGKLLLAATEEWARARSYSSMLIRSRVIRTEAHRFYESRGYERLKTQEVFTKRL